MDKVYSLCDSNQRWFEKQQARPKMTIISISYGGWTFKIKMWPFFVEWLICYKMVHFWIWDWCIVGYGTGSLWDCEFGLLQRMLIMDTFDIACHVKSTFKAYTDYGYICWESWHVALWWTYISLNPSSPGDALRWATDSPLVRLSSLVIGIDHDTVCAGVVGTAIRHSTSCAGRPAQTV